MTPKALAQELVFLQTMGFRSPDLTRLHHFTLVGRRVSLSDAIRYFGEKQTLRGPNILLADRCNYVAEQLRRGRHDASAVISEALLRWPLSSAAPAVAQVTTRLSHARSERANAKPSGAERGKELGDAGEALALALLTEHGYRAVLLRRGYPTYDLSVQAGSEEFLVSVKVARQKQHLRLGSRKSVERLSEGNYIFAFLPGASAAVDLKVRDYRLLILPALEVRQYALQVHDEYWATRGKADGYSVMVKAYDPRHLAQWNRWSDYEEAWQLLPPPHP